MGRSTRIGFLIGTALVTLLAAGVALFKNTETAPESIAVGILLVALVFGGVPGAVAGMVFALVRRPRLPYIPPVDMWSELVERCAEATRKAIAAQPDRADELSRDLDDLRGIAQLGRALGPVDRQHPVYRKLERAAEDLGG
ncbi:hypothetical protein Lesp02_28080 [Lentzea sp. NBRC 105346]|uniref:hypothetical protein n=1 Tax=Lentzea sp. NBRC 105346 TaxID=3032205 RepID=UPI002557AC3F|nr:hypothetical protein [Lentzea sp. NBRC 105346]GLZ30619.1 hypothetical protein Lesp02_28080 [Lentzea sp. NBRC 105346]